jgi:hypothetical protein
VDSVPPRGGSALAGAASADAASATGASVSAGVDLDSAADAGAADLALAGADSAGAGDLVGDGIRGGAGAACGLLLTGMSLIGAGPATITMGPMAARLTDRPTDMGIRPTTTIRLIRMPILIRAQISTTTHQA